MSIEAVQTKKARFPTIPETPPIENSTSAGTPLAIQNAPLQLMERCSVPAPGTTGPISTIVSLMITPKLFQNAAIGFEPEVVNSKNAFDSAKQRLCQRIFDERYCFRVEFGCPNNSCWLIFMLFVNVFCVLINVYACREFY